MLKGKLKYDEDIELDMEEEIPIEKLSNKKKAELEKKLEKENQTKLENIQFNYNIFKFERNKLTSFGGEKYEYLLPKYLEAGEETEEEGENKDKDKDNDSEIKGIRKEENITDSNSKINLLNNSNINLQSSDKNDITRLNRLTTSNKKKISLGNFDSESKLLMHDLSRMTLDKNDFKGSISFIERIKEIDKENNKKKDNTREDNNINDNDNINNNFNDIDLIQQDDMNNQ